MFSRKAAFRSFWSQSVLLHNIDWLPTTQRAELMLLALVFPCLLLSGWSLTLQHNLQNRETPLPFNTLVLSLIVLQHLILFKTWVSVGAHSGWHVPAFPFALFLTTPYPISRPREDLISPEQPLLANSAWNDFERFLENESYATLWHIKILIFTVL